MKKANVFVYFCEYVCPFIYSSAHSIHNFSQSFRFVFLPLRSQKCRFSSLVANDRLHGINFSREHEINRRMHCCGFLAAMYDPAPKIVNFFCYFEFGNRLNSLFFLSLSGCYYCRWLLTVDCRLSDSINVSAVSNCEMKTKTKTNEIMYNKGSRHKSHTRTHTHSLFVRNFSSGNQKNQKIVLFISLNIAKWCALKMY